MRLLRSTFRACYLLLSVLLFTAFRAQAQQPAPTWNPVVALGLRVGDSSVYVVKTVPDGKGNLYVAGSFAGRVHLGSTTLESTRSPTTGHAYTTDIFVAKYSLSTNRYLWASGTSGTGSESATQLVVSGSNLYIAGGTSAPVSRTATLTFGSTTYTTTDGACMFVAKLTDLGGSAAWQWGKVGTNDYLGNVAGLGVSGSTVYLAGGLSGTMKWDTKTAVSNQTLAYNAGDLLVVKLTDAGSAATVAWVQCIGSRTYEFARAFALTGNTLYIAGSYFNTTTLGSVSFPNSSADTAHDAFVVKLTDSGPAVTPVWAQHLGGAGNDEVMALSLTGSTLYLAGQFDSRRLAVGSDLTVANGDTTGKTNAALLARLTDAGSTSRFDWATTVPSVGAITVERLLQADKALFVAGSFYGDQVRFGSSTLLNSQASYNNGDLYVLRLNEASAGGASLAWAGQLGSTSYDFLYSLFLLSDRLYVQAYNTDATTIGTTAVPAKTSFLAAASPNSPLAATGPADLPGLALYPNPAHGRVTVQLPAGTSTEPAVLTLRDALGRVINSRRVAVPPTGLPYDLPLAELPAGLYLLQVQRGTAQITRQLLVE